MSRPRTRFIHRSSAAVLALALQLMLSGQPLLHASAHAEDGHSHVPARGGSVHADGHLPDDHPSLHGAAVFRQRPGVDAVAALPAVPCRFLVLPLVGLATTTGEDRWVPRAPPSETASRAPPLA